MEVLGNWQQDVLIESLKDFSADDIFNADETGLFYHLLPSKTLAFKGERCTSGKKSKERITVLVAANMSGTEKLPLLVIGRSTKPRCFKNKEPPVTYKANKKAWMSGDIFETSLKDWERKLKREGRKVLLYLNNFAGHSKIQLENITIKFLPPNTTAASQPCDQGIIQNLKVHYRLHLLRERFAAIDDKVDYKVDLLKALHFLRRSWEDVKPETLANCFRKAGFVKNVEAVEIPGKEVQTVEDNEELSKLWAELQELNQVEGPLNDYLAVDDHLATGGTLTLTEITADVSRTETEELEAESDNDVMDVNEEPELPLTTTRGAREAVRYLMRYSSNLVVLQLCDKVEDLLAKERIEKLRQKKITNYFSVNR